MSSPATQFRQDHPDLLYLDPGDPAPIEKLLQECGLLAPDEPVTGCSRAGEGNMNCTVRVSTPGQSLIVKQARPWVEKYPQFAAPWDRICREAEFYRLIATQPALAAMMPAVRHFDPRSHLLVLQDLGAASDCTGIYRGDQLDPADVSALARFLSRLHPAPWPGADRGQLRNREMRELNHAHIFSIPLDPANGLDLDRITGGLAAAASPLQTDPAFKAAVHRLGRDIYLTDGPCLLHGDFFPGSLLRTENGLRVIDPEFGFFGRPEFDAGVFLAHLLLANQPPDRATLWQREYLAPDGFDSSLMLQLAGVEVMRRLIGYAQLPLGYGIERKRTLLHLARELVLEPCLDRIAFS